MDWLIRKRSGEIMPYNKVKIEVAISKTLKATNTEENATEIANQVETSLYMNFFKKGNIPTVEEIQNYVEETLILRNLTDAAKAYILYREKRNETREVKGLFEDIEDLVNDYLKREDWRVQENSNMNYSLQGLNFYISSSVTARYWLGKMYPPKMREAHNNGDLHIHDIGILAPYCVGWDLLDLLKGGFRGASGKVESAPPRHLRSALGQVVNFIYTLQGEAAGAQAFSNFDTLLSPFIRYDDMSYKEVKQALQEFLFNINVPTRVGFQTPFSNITMDLRVPEDLKKTKVIVGGKEQGETYEEFQQEMNHINRAFAELMMEGDAKGRIFTFPIPTYNITKDFDWENDDLRPVWEMTGKYGVPYFSNFVNSDMHPEDARSMCCRLRLDNRELRKRGGGLFGSNPLTGSIGVVTINMPRIGYLSRNEEEFFDRLANIMETAKESLELKRKIVEKLTEQGLYPYTKYYLRGIKETQGSYWMNHFSTIGLIGMNEACMNFLKMGIGTEEGREWTIKVLNFMREQLSEFQEETGNLYNLEASPAEGASYRLAKKDKEKFPDIYSMGVFSPYYTNSVHLPVDEPIDIFELLQHQNPMQVLFTGGTVVHLYLGEAITDWRMVRKLTRMIVTRFSLPYFSFTPTFSICPVHGYIMGERFYCPYSHSEEELKQFGTITELDAEQLKEMEPDSYKILKDDEPKEKVNIFLNIENKEV
ncbi:ribonucleoside triphosphate reductase [candidate division WOR-3 bacterium]|nr:ribonucleoside triphosphate reductase [candidate division WOR-3 bacterium]